ncbi:lantibiotic dehydratase family protein [Chryseobacterium paridis]|uniref:Lantibiotic dehydratase family protein n=1 Tax=Chryseobacterium paridis TaxID=2800328 RepID=A0ABS1FUP6_9FLAO|nr:lantibiotic dehydratase family protein [Chryseobacterium paridis]MBK1896145.1 lantibiotic dehydratase family protein [Chryseobacterium paridis]
MPRFPYKFFDNFIVRTPLFSNKNFLTKYGSEGFLDNELKEICINPVFQEAIYLASPDLYLILIKWLSNKELQDKDSQKLKDSLLKYYIRMSTRCTPFGLFSGVGLGQFDKENIECNSAIKQNNFIENAISRDTKLDMHFLTTLSKNIETELSVKDQLLFYPNNSIYIVGDKIRYVEYEIKNDKRNYIISTATLTDELKLVLHFSRKGGNISQLSEILINDEITKEEAHEFIQELILNKVLVSELEPNVSGDDFFENIIKILSKIEEKKEEASTLVLVRSKLLELDQKVGNLIEKYFEIEELLKSFKVQYERKYLFQSDLYFNNQYKLSNHWIKQIKSGISFLNKISTANKETHLERFKRAFKETFENEELPLSYVLDTEIGIGYRQDIEAKGMHSYLDDLEIKEVKNEETIIKLTPIQIILNKKLQEALHKGNFIVTLSDEDFADIEENWVTTPYTISFMGELISENGFEKMILYGVNGSSAANLIGRFCSEKSKIKDIAKTISKKEEKFENDVILAEVIHLPDARIGNIIRRPILRTYEIPYLAKSTLPPENQILLEDLYISIKDDRIILRSKTLNKEVKPKLTNAHNYYSNSLPIYHFLSDINSQDIKSGLTFDWGGLNQLYFFLPRVEYKNIILCKAQWKITISDVSFLFKIKNDADQLISKLKMWRNEKKIPKWIQLVKSDKTLALNLENYHMARLFMQTINNEKSILIEEFLYDENDNFRHEFIFPMYKIE